MTAKSSEQRLPVLPPRQYDEGVVQAAKALESRYRPQEFIMVASKILPELSYEVLLEVDDFVEENALLMATDTKSRSVALARLITRAAFQTANDEARSAHKTLPYPRSP